jgi:PRC-barrel domain
MDDFGPPSSYLALEPGTPVYASDGERIGVVEHVLADPDADLFDGIVIDRSVLPGGWRFADADQVDRIYESGVVLTLDRPAAERLPEPSANPGTLKVDPADAEVSKLEEKLLRAWDRISGK